MSTATRDLVFGVVAFDPRIGCGTACSAHREGVRRWAASVRRYTDAATTEVALFTGPGRGNIAADHGTARVLRDADVRTIEGDFRDSPERVAHTDGRRYMWCVVRNRWFVLRDFLRAHAHEYRHVLMTDVRDAVVQANPFAWTPRSGTAAFDLRRTIVLSGEGSGSVMVLAQSPKGKARTLGCAGTPALDASAQQRLLATDPLNAGVTLGGVHAFLNFSAALADVIHRVTTASCLDVKDCTDQGLYNLLVYQFWKAHLPHTRRHIVPMEGGALSYTLGHKKGRVSVDSDGHVRDDTKRYVPPVVHQFGKGRAGKALQRTKFAGFLTSLRDGGASAEPVQERSLACHQCLMFDGTASGSAALAAFCARRCSLT